jgi:homocysteine S-methyltransferase
LRDLLDDVTTPAWVSFACRDDRHISDGSSLWAAAGLFADQPNVLAVGINCTPPQYVLPLIAEVRTACPDKAVVAYPNSGEVYRSDDNSWSGTACDLDRDFNVSEWYRAGAKLIGGCCRTDPQDIAKIKMRLAA